MPAQTKIHSLIKRFEENREAYLSGRYGETQLRREFIDPFFKELGWDMDNEGGFAEAYKDVIHEDAIKIGGFSKAPDYCFRIGGTRKFFIETKKPSVNLKEDASPAFQLRRYAWSAKLPLSILTDFEEFAVYDSRVKPVKTDKPGTARILYFTYKDYLSRWDEIAGIFSREAVLKGSFDKYAQSVRTKKGTAEVDQAFLDEIESWREMLAKNIAIRNSSLSVRELNFVVQRTIDRIIFLRISEDRGIETYGTLQALLNGQNIYARLFEIFERADERYNSGIFHFRKEKDRPETPDELSARLKIDDEVLKSIFKSIYYPESSYEFSVLPVEILGQVYEQFLGQVIQLTDGHRATIEEKPEVKKAGGVYYTPAYIVDYIVKNTVGKLLEGKTPKQASKLKILDPACGSGSFLIGAYQYLLTWHRDWYVKDGVEKWIKGKQPALYQHSKDSKEDWRLTTFEKKRILLNNIYGVDIDSQAVEVTKLSLLLKVLEGENGEVLSKQYRLFHERVLPDLGNNIKCGNSLIASDIYNSGQAEIWNDNEERLRVNAFDWEKEFPEIMGAGGFDAVIGNPPYIGFHGFKEEKKYFNENFLSASGKYDIYVLFIEKAIDLINEGGLVSYICPTGFMKRNHGKEIRDHLLKKCTIKEIVDFEHQQIFKDVSNYTGIIVLAKPCEKNNKIRYKNDLMQEGFDYAQGSLSDKVWVFRNPCLEEVITHITKNKNIVNLSTITENISEGIVTGLNELYLINIKEVKNNKFYNEHFKPCLRGRNIRRYYIEAPSEFVFYPYDCNNKLIKESVIKNKNPKYYSHLTRNKTKIESRGYFAKSSKKWYELWNQRKVKNFENIKIVVPELSDKNRFAVDNSNFYYGDTVCGFYLKNSCGLNINYVLGLLNSTLVEWFYKKTTVPKANNFFIYKTMFLGSIPIRNIDFNNKEDKKFHDKVVELAEYLQNTQRKLSGAKTDHEKTALQRQIDATDNEIDRLVYQLYGLTEEEIKIVESSTGRKGVIGSAMPASVARHQQ